MRLEARPPFNDKLTHPRCVGGERRCPPEDCRGPLLFMEQRDAIPVQFRELLFDIRGDLQTSDLEAFRERLESIENLREWLTLDEFYRRALNRRLKQYATRDADWQWQEVIEL